jgi:hypothetical protein
MLARYDRRSNAQGGGHGYAAHPSEFASGPGVHKMQMVHSGLANPRCSYTAQRFILLELLSVERLPGWTRTRSVLRFGPFFQAAGVGVSTFPRENEGVTSWPMKRQRLSF